MTAANFQARQAKALNASEAYKNTLKLVLDDGIEVDPVTLGVGAGKSTKELLNFSVLITNPSDRLLYTDSRKINLPAAVARFVWMMAGSDRLFDIAFYEEKVRYFSDNEISIPGSNYGMRILQPRPGLDQLKAVIERLKADSASRRAAISIYHPEDAVRPSKDIPCAFGLFYHIRNGSLHATTIMRSNNASGLLHYNLFEFSLLAEAVAAEVGVSFGSLTHFASSMHIYQQDYAATRIIADGPDIPTKIMPQMSREPSPIAQIRELVILEATVRHEAAGINGSNIERWIEKGQSVLSTYWQQLYFLLLFHMIVRRKDAVALRTLRTVLQEPYLSYLPENPIATDPKVPELPLELSLAGALSVDAQIVPITQTRRIASIKSRAAEWEASTKKTLTWTQFSRIQDHFSQRLAARGDAPEVSLEEFTEALRELHD